MKRRVLGKGIEAIISNKPTAVETSDAKYFEVDIDDIYPNPFQPRKNFPDHTINELAASIKESGLIQPIVVYKKDQKYFLIAGERRWRAVQILKWKKIPVILKDFSVNDVMIGALVENIQREDLNAIELAEGIELLIHKSGLNQEQTAEKLGMNRTTLTNFLRLLKLPEAVKQGIISGDITQGHARSLLSLQEDDILDAYAVLVKKKLSVRQTENMVKNYYLHREKRVVDPDIVKAEERLAKLFSTKVKLNYTKEGRGKIEIFFSKLDEFDRIYKSFLKE